MTYLSVRAAGGTVTGERMTIRLHGDKEAIPGEYTLRDGARVERRPSSDLCPYCRERLTHLATDGALRIIRALGEPTAGTQAIQAEPVPPNSRVLKCDGCVVIFCAPEAT